MRSIFTFAATALIAVLLWTTLVALPTHAANATWDGSAITYEDKKYEGPISNERLSDLTLLPGTKAYTYLEPAQDPSDGSSSSSNSPPRKLRVIYFAPNTDEKAATSAKFKTYSYINANEVRDPSNPTDISLVSVNSTTPGGIDNPGTSSCNVDGGLGWIICPVTNTLATGMDFIFTVLSGFLEVKQPESTNTENALFRAWSYMRTIANIAFVIAFLIIIYSQLTNVGIDNYSVKKLLPRLIIAAILVNLSYLICSIAIDISNILGYSIQNIFINIRNSLVGTESNQWDVTSWESVAGFILSGGTAAAAIGVGAGSAVLTYGAGAIFLLLPALVIALLAVLVALLIMAARQAIIIILVVVAPLAFVAYLLPNTEKYFEKWRGVFITMLIIFPAFSVIFGGSQLAAATIINTPNVSLNLIILAMLIQVAPLFITPLLIQFSGNLLGRIAGLVNNPQKGILDRTRNFSQDRADGIKAKRLGQPAKRYQVLRRGGQAIDQRRRRREGWKAANTAMGDARWANSEDAHDIAFQTQEAGDIKTLGETTGQLRYNTAKTSGGRIERLDTALRDVKVRASNADARAELKSEETMDPALLQQRIIARQLATDTDTAKKRFENQYTEMSTGSTPERFKSVQGIDRYSSIAIQSLIDSRQVADRITSAQLEQSKTYHEVLDKNVFAAQEAAGIGEGGLLRIQGRVAAAKIKESQEELSNFTQLLQYQAISNHVKPKDYAVDLHKKLIANAPEVQGFEKGRIKAVYQILAEDAQGITLEQARASELIPQEVLDEIMENNSGTLKAKGMFHLQANPGLSLQRYLAKFNSSDTDSNIYGTTEAAVRKRFIRDMQRGRLESLSDTDADKLGSLKAGVYLDTANNFDEYIKAFDKNNEKDQAILRKIYGNMKYALTEDNIPSISSRLAETHKIDEVVSEFFGDTPTPRTNSERKTPVGQPDLPADPTIGAVLPDEDPSYYDKPDPDAGDS